MLRALRILGVLVLLAAINWALPYVVPNPYYVRILMLCGVNVMLAVSLNLVNGFTGQFSIGHAGFMAVGAYTSAVLTMRTFHPWIAAMSGLPDWLAHGIVLLAATLLGGGLAALAGLAVGLPSLRLRGDYLAIVTLGFGEIIRVIILNVDAIGGARGLSGVPVYTSFFWLALGVVTVVWVSFNLLRSTHGRAMLAIREDEVAAEALGVPTTKYKVMAFVVSAFFAGVAGALYAHYDSYLNPSSFTFLRSIEIIAMIVLGGLGSISGAILAAIVLTILPEALRSVREYRMVIYAVLLIVLMITRPSGIMGTRELPLPWKRKKAAA